MLGVDEFEQSVAINMLLHKTFTKILGVNVAGGLHVESHGEVFSKGRKGLLASRLIPRLYRHKRVLRVSSRLTRDPC